MAEEKITRHQLYELVWSQPRFSIAKRFNVTDADLISTCKQLQVPLPKPGYWQRKKFNTQPPPPPLPEYPAEQEIALPSRPAKEIVESPVQILQRQIENDASLKLVVPKKLATLDKLILRAKASLDERKKSNWTRNGLINTGRDELDINVSPQNAERALRFMDTLLKILYSRGHSIEMDYDGSNAVILGDKIKISLLEKSTRTIIERKDLWNTQELNPSGKLSFRMNKSYNQKEFMDGKILIENQLARIVAELEIQGERLKLQKIERERIWAQQKIEQEEREKRQRIREKELSDFKLLLIDAQRWRQTEMIRSYVNAVESRLSPNVPELEQKRKWIEWARKKADWYDPTMEIDDTLLSGVDCDKLNN